MAQPNSSLILSNHLCLCSPYSFFPLGFEIKIVYAFINCSPEKLFYYYPAVPILGFQMADLEEIFTPEFCMLLFILPMPSALPITTSCFSYTNTLQKVII
jgi:hypothetical protein